VSVYIDIDSRKSNTKIIALVEPPDCDLGRMASEGGCRLIVTSLLVGSSGEEVGNAQEVSSREKGCVAYNYGSGLLRIAGGP
jgi:hypothetical protein